MENPQNLVTPEQVHVEAKSPLFQVTPLSKYLAMILFIALPFLGFWIGTVFQSTQEIVVPTPMVMQKESEVKEVKDPMTYTSPENTYSIAFENGISVAPLVSYTDQASPREEDAKEVFEEGTVQIQGVFTDNGGPFVVNRRSYFDIMLGRGGVTTEHSCCSGIKYAYDKKSNEWQAESFSMDTSTANPKTEKVPFSLSKNGSCDIAQTYGNNTYYVIQVGGIEGYRSKYYYYLLTDQEYVLRFNLSYDLKGDYSNLTYGPTAEEIARAEKVLAGVTIPNGKVVTATCK